MYKKPGDTGAGIEVAIKTIKNSKYDSKTETESFLKEMSVMSTLIHPNVVRFYGLVQKGNIESTMIGCGAGAAIIVIMSH